MSCVTDFETDWSLCDIGVSRAYTGLTLRATFTIGIPSIDIAASIAQNYGGVVTDAFGDVLMLLSPVYAIAGSSGAALRSATTQPAPGAPITYLTSTQTGIALYTQGNVPSNLSGEQVLVYVGPLHDFSGYSVGDIWTPVGAGAADVLESVVTIGSGQGGTPISPTPTPSPGTGSFTLGVPSIQGQAVAGSTLSVAVPVHNAGQSAASDSISIVVLDATSQQAYVTTSPVPTGSVQAGGSTTVTVSAALPSSASGRRVYVIATDSAGNTNETEVVVSGATGSPGPSKPFPWLDVAGVGLLGAGLVVFAAGIAGGER